MQKREQIIERARTWVETPVLHQHAILGFGVDCWNLVKAVGEAEAVLQVDPGCGRPSPATGGSRRRGS
jgi:cell wall-associated NlpC family hydrolase